MIMLDKERPKKYKTRFMLYEDCLSRNFESKVVPNVCFEVKRTFRDENDPETSTHVKVSLYQSFVYNKKGFACDLEKFLVKQELHISPEEPRTEINFADPSNNKLNLTLQNSNGIATNCSV